MQKRKRERKIDQIQKHETAFGLYIICKKEKKSTFTNPSKAYIKDLIMSSGFQTLKAHYSKSQIFVQKFNLPRFYLKTFFLGKSKLSIFTHFFFFDNFFVKSKLSTPKKCKTQQFLEYFTQFFFGKSSWTKIEDFELCGFQGSWDLFTCLVLEMLLDHICSTLFLWVQYVCLHLDEYEPKGWVSFPFQPPIPSK